MGQSTVDLPDPLDHPNPAPAASADDLLAQLAGDEVDRLLAESDAEGGNDQASAAGEPVDVAQPVAVSQPMSEIEDVFAQFDAMEASFAAPESIAILPVQPLTAEADGDETALVERAALAGAGELSGLPGSVELAPVSGPLPIIFRPLIWLNAPLDACPDGVREALGKVAVLTLVNAVAVLAYVLIFRRHH